MIRTLHDQVPPRVDYALGPYGRTLGPILDAMQAWGEHHHGTAEPQRAAG